MLLCFFYDKKSILPLKLFLKKKQMDLLSLKQRFGIIGNSSGLENALSVAVRVAPTDLSVLIMGESGVGKEVFSHIIHALSSRKHNAFIAVNCGAIPEGTIDSELFGHEKGAFTGASDSRKGYFEGVDGGTIFLDEIGEMPLGTQARLLRVLETGEFIRVGSSKVQKTDVRVIAATNVNLADAVKQGKFREDLYYRLNTVPIYIPSLRDRKEDIALLFRKFCVDFAEKNRIAPISLSTQAREMLTNYAWPGNIRELKNIAEQISILSISRDVDAQDLLKYLPQVAANRSLPAVTTYDKNEPTYSERDLLYRLLFDMRRELSDLKQMIFQFMGNNAMADNLPAHNNAPALYNNDSLNLPATQALAPYEPLRHTQPAVVIASRDTIGRKREEYNAAEVVEESLSVRDNEKDLIVKALQKHKNRRKDAAADLGISERTLYRKIRDFDIKE